ncbi:arylsulfatase [Kribbella sp. NBC_00709]|uniref:arylsulfatase n=1 Tax=Kribbella sp. NBC_00709 TaxID=2975972 RepID=UPI002E2A58DC|nr:arylsulfatase [Kribbella sp. NBC_00709]
MAEVSDATPIDRTVLPPPDPSFHGEIRTDFADSSPEFPEPVKPPAGAPNVLLVMGDDIGFGHMSAFGGPARTPVFDRLAQHGLSYTNFHTTPVCAASRAALLTGRNAHAVGMGSVPEASAGFPGYNASVPRSAATVLEILRLNGYATAWVGKTHLTPMHEITAAGPFDRWPMGMGAEYFYGFFGPGVSQWHPPLWENSTPLQPPRTPEEGYHLEADMADHTIGWIQRQQSIQPDKPWIAYYAPNGHKPPVGVPREWIDKYRGEFDDGYDVLRDRIIARQKELGIVSADTELSPWPETLPSWDELTDKDRKVGARWMEVFCGAVEHTDYQVGRIVEAVEQLGELDNTLIIFIAGDNGPTPEGGLHGAMNKLTYFNGLTESLDDLVERLDEFGGPTSHGCYPAAWAYATSTPYTYGKMVTSGGGCSTAVVMSWPARITDRGSFRRQFHHLIDVSPTILELVGVPEPTRVNGIDQMPMHGVSMAYTFDDATAPDRHTTQYFELTGSRAIYKDGWWAGTRHGLDGVTAAAKEVVPFDEDAWELYDLRNDFGHATNLAAQHPERLAELQELFDHEARTYNVYPMVNNAFELLTAKRPRLVSGNRASYSAGTIRLPEDGVIDIKNRSFSVIADVDNPDGDAEGMLVTMGGETGGFAFYVLEGIPTFQYNWLGRERYTITSSQPLPKGASTIRFDFAYDGGGPGKGGTGTLRIDGEAVGDGRIDKTVPVYFSTDDTFDVGEDWGTPISSAYKPPFRFTGTLKTVTLDAQ